MFCFTSGCKDFRRSHLLIFEIGNAFKKYAMTKNKRTCVVRKLLLKMLIIKVFKLKMGYYSLMNQLFESSYRNNSCPSFPPTSILLEH